MGKRRRSKEQGEESKKRDNGEWKIAEKQFRENNKFRDYYLLQKIVDDSDVEEFINIMVFCNSMFFSVEK